MAGMEPDTPLLWVPVAALAAGFAILSLAEALNPGRARGSSDRRLVTNFGFGILNVALGAALPIGSIAAALFAAGRGFGLFRQVDLAWPLAFLILLLARSLAAYGMHRLSHAVPMIWRVHRVHHADGQIDVSTGLRNHPLELLLTIPVVAGVVVSLGPGVALVIAVDAVLLVTSLWQHADLALPPRVDRLLGTILVTPAFHRVHHAAERALHDSNYGDLLLVWDRLFGTYRAPAAPAAAVGLAEAAAHHDRIGRQLAGPFLPQA
jgi:sterol desaturase/sphingolipid hydroxylase (fatty acid hydroxylase superfamily)